MRRQSPITPKVHPSHSGQVLRSLLSDVCPFLWILLLFGCGGSSSQDSDAGLPTPRCEVALRVVNGNSCSNSETSVAKLSFMDPLRGPSGCSGIVIGRRSVLTAAHCFLISGATQATVQLGAFTAESTKIHLHPQARIDPKLGAVFDDVAIVETSATLPTSPVPLLLSRDAQSGEPIFIYGYGLDEQGNQGVLRVGSMRLSNVTNDHLYASYLGTGSNSCQGDSGGPAILVDEQGTQIGLVGVISSGKDSACRQGDTTLFVRLESPSVVGFLESTVPDLSVN